MLIALAFLVVAILVILNPGGRVSQYKNAIYYLLIADGLAVKEGETASPTIQPDYREIGRWLGERLRTKSRRSEYRRLENVRGCTGGDQRID